MRCRSSSASRTIARRPLRRRQGFSRDTSCPSCAGPAGWRAIPCSFGVIRGCTRRATVAGSIAIASDSDAGLMYEVVHLVAYQHVVRLGRPVISLLELDYMVGDVKGLPR